MFFFSLLRRLCAVRLPTKLNLLRSLHPFFLNSFRLVFCFLFHVATKSEKSLSCLVCTVVYANSKRMHSAEGAQFQYFTLHKSKKYTNFIYILFSRDILTKLYSSWITSQIVFLLHDKLSQISQMAKKYSSPEFESRELINLSHHQKFHSKPDDTNKKYTRFILHPYKNL